MKILRRVCYALLLTSLVLGSTSALAVDTEINAVGVKFDPMFVYIEPGQTISWNNMIGHNVETIDAMTPEGFAKVNTELGDDVTITFDAPGIYVYKCTPHWGARMGGIIMVGQPEDPAAIIEQYRAAIEEDKSLLPAKGLLKKFEKDLEKRGS